MVAQVVGSINVQMYELVLRDIPVACKDQTFALLIHGLSGLLCRGVQVES